MNNYDFFVERAIGLTGARPALHLPQLTPPPPPPKQGLGHAERTATEPARAETARRPASPSDSFDLFPTRTFPGFHAIRRLQRSLAAALLSLPLLLGLAAPAAAQTIDSTEITEGETKTFTITVPSTWSTSLRIEDSSIAGAATATVEVCDLVDIFAIGGIPHDWDVCYNHGPRSSRTFTIEIRANADSIDDPDETFNIRVTDVFNPFDHSFTITIREAPLLPVGPEHMPQIVLSQDNFVLAEPPPQGDNCSIDTVGTEQTHTTVNGVMTTTRDYGPVLTSVDYRVQLDRSPGAGKYVSVEIWDPTDLDRPDVRDGYDNDGSIRLKGRFSENARIHGISWDGGRQGRITIPNSVIPAVSQTAAAPLLNTYHTFTDEDWNEPRTVTVNIHCAQHDVTNPLPVWHFAFRHDVPRPVNPGSNFPNGGAEELPLGYETNRKGDNSRTNTSLKIAEVRVADSTEPAAITSNVDGKLVLDAHGSGFTTRGKKMIDLEFVWNHPDNELLNDYDDAGEQFAAFRVKLRTVEPSGHPVQEKIVLVDAINPGDVERTTISWYAALEAKGHVGWVYGRPDPADSKYEWNVVPLDRRWNEVEAERITQCVLLTSKAGPNGGRNSRIDKTANPTCPAALQAESEGASTLAVSVPDTAVANVQATAVDDTSASVSWDAVEHATSYDVSWRAESSDAQTVLSGDESVTGASATIRHHAQEAMTLTVTVTPEYIDDNGLTQPLKDLAGTATLEVGPQPLGGGGTNGGGDGGGVGAGEGDAQASAIAACVSADLMQHVEARIEIAITDRWVRIRNALIGQPNAITLAEVKEIYENRKANGWDTNRLEEVIAAMECIENAMQQSPVPDATPDPAPDPDPTPTPDPEPEPEPVACVSPQLRADAKSYSEETWRESPDHVERWLRVLQTFSGTANDSTVMTPAEAQEYVNRGWDRWEPVLEALKCMEQQALDSN